MAVGPGDAPGPGQSQGGNQPARRGPRCRVGGQRPQPRATGLGRVFPPRQLGAEVRPARQLRPGAPGDLCQHQARTPRPELAAPLHQGVGRPAGDLPSQPENTAEDCACLTVNDVGKPGAGEPHARFDRGPLAKQQPWRAGIDAPTGKPAGLSPTAYRSLTSQRPTLPAGQAVGSKRLQGSSGGLGWPGRVMAQPWTASWTATACPDAGWCWLLAACPVVAMRVHLLSASRLDWWDWVAGRGRTV